MRTAAELAEALAAGETTSVAHHPGAPRPDRRGRRRRSRLPACRRRGSAARRRGVRRAACAPASRGAHSTASRSRSRMCWLPADCPTTCGSRILEGWVPPYDATVVARLRGAGLPILGKTNMDEFAMGSSTEHSAYGPTHNPWDLSRIPGGSGGGSAAAVAAYEAPLAIGTDTGGSIRQPGAVTGTVGVKPTYGGVSRYGLVALANSLDQAGPVTRTVLDAALLHELIGGHDPLDSTSIEQPVPGLRRRRPAGRRRRPHRRPHRGRHRARRRGLPGRRAGPVRESVELMTKAGAEVVEVSCPHFVHALATYYLILPAEASSNLARFDAMRYGLRVTPDGDPERRGRHARHPRGRLRRRGEAPDHPRHLRPVQRLLRRLLRPGAEGPHAGRARLRRGVRAGRRAGQPDGADHGVQDRREGRRPAGDVPQRPGHDPGQPLRRPRHLGAERPRRRGRPACRRPDPGAGPGRRPGLPRRRRPRGAARAGVGRPAARPGPSAGQEPSA